MSSDPSSSSSSPALSPEIMKIKIRLPTLKEPALTHWPSYRQQLKNYLSNHGIKSIDGPLNAMEEALLFNSLAEGFAQTQYDFYVFINNSGSLGSIALKEFDNHFRTNDTSHKLEMFRRIMDIQILPEDYANRDAFHG
jgi:hypothetical protein